MELGVQLYTVREHTKTLDDFSLTLQRVADIGYRNVQISNTCEFEADWLQKQLRQTGLRCVMVDYAVELDMAAKSQSGDFIDALLAPEDSRICDYIMLTLMPAGFSTYDEFRRLYFPVAEALSSNGRKLLYHNHVTEFGKNADGKNVLECMADDCSELGFALDTYWIQAAGGDPAWWIRRFSGRMPCVHLKDMAYNSGIRMSPVYEGNMNFDAILEACRDAETKYLIVEQDNCYGEDPFECLERSYRNLRSRGVD
jgi:sugar phosphate isomerase/epimerase